MTDFNDNNIANEDLLSLLKRLNAAGKSIGRDDPFVDFAEVMIDDDLLFGFRPDLVSTFLYGYIDSLRDILIHLDNRKVYKKLKKAIRAKRKSEKLDIVEK